MLWFSYLNQHGRSACDPPAAPLAHCAGPLSDFGSARLCYSRRYSRRRRGGLLQAQRAHWTTCSARARPNGHRPTPEPRPQLTIRTPLRPPSVLGESPLPLGGESRRMRRVIHPPWLPSMMPSGSPSQALSCAPSAAPSPPPRAHVPPHTVFNSALANG
jgi:hypothetical protein